LIVCVVCEPIFALVLPELYNKDDLLRHVGITKAEFDKMSLDDIAREFMWNGFKTDTVVKDKPLALGLYFIGMQAAWKAGWEPHRWATLFARVLVILRKHKNYETELKVLDEVIPKYPYLSKYHQWEKRREKVKSLISRRSKTKGFLSWLMNIIP